MLNDAFAGVGPEERQKLLHVSGAEVAWPLLCLQHQLLDDRASNRASNSSSSRSFSSTSPTDMFVLVLQEGTGAAVMSGYVEVVFDNSDGRFPVS